MGEILDGHHDWRVMGIRLKLREMIAESLRQNINEIDIPPIGGEGRNVDQSGHSNGDALLHGAVLRP